MVANIKLVGSPGMTTNSALGCSTRIKLVGTGFPLLPLFSGYGLKGCGERYMLARINRPMFDNGACRVFPKIVITFPIVRWPDGSGNEAAAAVRTNVTQNSIDARGTESTLVATDACFQ